MQRWDNDNTFLSKWLNNELSEEEKHAFEQSADGKAFKDLIIATQALKTPEYDANHEYDELKQKIGKPSSTKGKIIPWRTYAGWAIAASVALIATVIYLITPKLPPITTSVAEQKTIFLPDSSRVILNANSTLAYSEDDWTEGRNIKLTGEAYFDVKKGSTFTVATTKGTIEVLGTTFNVKDRADWLDVSCYSGKVKVLATHATSGEILNPGQEIFIDGKGQAKRKSIDQNDTQPSWTNGLTTLNDVPLQQAIEELKYVFGIEVVIKSALPESNYSGAFPHSNVETAIKLVLDPTGLTYSYDPKTKTLMIN